MRILIIIFSIFLGGCSVVMESQHSGVSPTTLGACQNRACLISNGAISVSKSKNTEIFQAHNQTGSSARAVMDGVLDVSTLGVWEVAGTPIAGAENKKTFYQIKVTYQADGQTIKYVQLLS